MGIDINLEILEVARERTMKVGLANRIQYLEHGVTEIRGKLVFMTYAAYVCCLAFSEMSDEGRSYAISTAYSILKSGGLFMIADESNPRSRGKRLLRILVHAPVRLLTYSLTQLATKPLEVPSVEVKEAGFVDVETDRIWGDRFMIIKGTRGQ